jgi:hypothetical protein
MFINQLVHVILRNMLDGCEDAFIVRAAELFFRSQRLTTHEGSLIAADEEIVEGSRQAVSPLVSMLGLPDPAGIEVLNDENAAGYWERSDQFDMAIDLTTGRPGLAALAEAMRRWIGHLHGIDVAIEPLEEMKEVNLAWYVGLDADATKIGDLLWAGDDVDEATISQVVGLFRLTFRDPSLVMDKIRGEPIYLILAMTADRLIRMKPQNLVIGLPIRHMEAVS